MGLPNLLGDYSDPSKYIAALTRRIRELNVTVEEDRKVIDFQMDHGRVTFVRTETDVFPVYSVLCVVHTWGSTLLKQMGWQIPVKTFVHQRYVTSPVSHSLVCPPINANSHDGYIRPAALILPPPR